MNTAVNPLGALALAVALAVVLIPSTARAEEGAYVLDLTVLDINGNEVDLSAYEGKVLLIVNVASKCGLTPQYAELMELHNSYADQGLAILGFPANNFRNQEPGSNEEIKLFCTQNYNVAFDMFAKISVFGDDISPLYRRLTSAETNAPFAGDIQWNFTKFLVGRDGRVIARFEPQTKPTDEAVIAAIESALAR